eukprot:gnl/MRDRNA2_/MRDRNA2_86477_c0_seq1.p1 gnl/MRDRNA2_/MRDRNA2_86477_c0~~gnl/MRDRNA2_/MRDRNA2_86477_c0_seq1.p1  ORF type:complete len:1158 (-),score=-4.77 gnl/MRDRNA2_/MRDRNA2_86477_c0_seq1:55-3315(-)
MTTEVCGKINGDESFVLTRINASLPIMVGSKACWLSGKNKSQLISLGEDENESGGYFISNGVEKFIRLFITTRRNYVVALRRKGNLRRGKMYTDAMSLVRCVRADTVSQTVRAYYLIDGTILISSAFDRVDHSFRADIIMRSFLDTNEEELLKYILNFMPKVDKTNLHETENPRSFVAATIDLMLKRSSNHGLDTRIKCLEYIGRRFRSFFTGAELKKDADYGLKFLQNYIFIQLVDGSEKFNLLTLMVIKVLRILFFRLPGDNLDALSLHEIQRPGELFCKFLRGNLLDSLCTVMEQIVPAEQVIGRETSSKILNFLKLSFAKVPPLGKKIEYLLATGNLSNKPNADLQQNSGYTVAAERFNFYRFISHFRSFHKGSKFTDVRETSIRRVFPDMWGFVCPVDTPDGIPCGLLNHLTPNARVVEYSDIDETRNHEILSMLIDSGMTAFRHFRHTSPLNHLIMVTLDGRLCGYFQLRQLESVIYKLRLAKSIDLCFQNIGEKSMRRYKIPWHTEVVYIPYEQFSSYPSITIFTTEGRIVRPIRQIATGKYEFVGTLEQVFMEIACQDGSYGGTFGTKFTHFEINPREMLSVVGGMIPFSDYNQSPRNTYQCQMSKQTIATPGSNFSLRNDNKISHLHIPQTPLARTEQHDRYKADHYPFGVNAVVAVIAYTGHDMEDAMIINKSSVERGFAHASTISSGIVDREEIYTPCKNRKNSKLSSFECVSPTSRFADRNKFTAHHGTAFRHYGVQPLIRTDSLNSIETPDPGLVTLHYKQIPGFETPATIESVSYARHISKRRTKARVKIVINTNPVIGDKFASRAGQKGILSKLWPDIDMPFCERTGIRPDLILNPNAIPSRMTIGMLMESACSKAGALEWKYINCSPFQCADGQSRFLTHFVGDILENNGFHAAGNETLISGFCGKALTTYIHIGCVFYQRLRHLVSDKIQVRSVGPRNPLTHQPTHGRKFGGGIRFGEMERDSLLAHGASFLLQDRLCRSSDSATIVLCRRCGSLVSSPLSKIFKTTFTANNDSKLFSLCNNDEDQETFSKCILCDKSDQICFVVLPYVIRHLAVELAAMNVKIQIEIT